jgi:hypothetical protein
MACNCKNDGNEYSVASDVNLTKRIINYSLRIIMFSLSLLTLPIIVIASIWILFRTLVLNKDVNITGMLKFMVKAFKNANNNHDDDDDDDDYYDDEEEYELMDVENITYQKTDSK